MKYSKTIGQLLHIILLFGKALKVWLTNSNDTESIIGEQSKFAENEIKECSHISTIGEDSLECILNSFKNRLNKSFFEMGAFSRNMSDLWTKDVI
ncbi:hypothetical protein ESP131_16025 [Exiguobacterium sp. U13-1]|nr:hypothetical protein ESP131_16025 [Exiguobacterium sp. U13-1]HBQ76883.1 hypothetical protein [Exiguobacterium sp.]HCD57911.1 hypothetical protein [Exiguobacterium sp.]